MKPSELIFRIIVALILPPFGVLGLKDVGCGSLLLLTLLTLLFWVPGQIVSVLMIVKAYNGLPQSRSYRFGH